MPRADLSSKVFPSDLWTQGDHRTALDSIYTRSIARAHEAAAWYKSARVWKRRLGRGSRTAALAFVGVGGLIPFFGEPIALPGTALSVTVPAIFSAAFFGAAAGAVALDKLFGWTSGWTRYTLTGAQIEHATDDFQLQWHTDIAKWVDKEPTAQEVETQLKKLREFVALTNAFVQAETEAWVAEFQAATQAVEGRIRRVDVK